MLTKRWLKRKWPTLCRPHKKYRYGWLIPMIHWIPFIPFFNSDLHLDTFFKSIDNFLFKNRMISVLLRLNFDTNNSPVLQQHNYTFTDLFRIGLIGWDSSIAFITNMWHSNSLMVRWYSCYTCTSTGYWPWVWLVRKCASKIGLISESDKGCYYVADGAETR